MISEPWLVKFLQFVANFFVHFKIIRPILTAVDHSRSAVPIWGRGFGWWYDARCFPLLFTAGKSCKTHVVTVSMSSMILHHDRIENWSSKARHCNHKLKMEPVPQHVQFNTDDLPCQPPEYESHLRSLLDMILADYLGLHSLDCMSRQKVPAPDLVPARHTYSLQLCTFTLVSDTSPTAGLGLSPHCSMHCWNSRPWNHHKSRHYMRHGIWTKLHGFCESQQQSKSTTSADGASLDQLMQNAYIL